MGKDGTRKFVRDVKNKLKFQLTLIRRFSKILRGPWPPVPFSLLFSVGKKMHSSSIVPICFKLICCSRLNAVFNYKPKNNEGEKSNQLNQASERTRDNLGSMRNFTTTYPFQNHRFQSLVLTVLELVIMNYIFPFCSVFSQVPNMLYFFKSILTASICASSTYPLASMDHHAYKSFFFHI